MCCTTRSACCCNSSAAVHQPLLRPCPRLAGRIRRPSAAAHLGPPRWTWQPAHPPTCASSLSWCGKRRSSPPVWMSILGPSTDEAMALHSMCQPAGGCVGGCGCVGGVGGVGRWVGGSARACRCVVGVCAGASWVGPTKHEGSSPAQQQPRPQLVWAAGGGRPPASRAGCTTVQAPPRSPGRPGPQGLSQVGSPGLAAFHSAKSAGCRLSPQSAPSPASAAAPTAQGLSLPYVWPPALQAGRGAEYGSPAWACLSQGSRIPRCPLPQPPPLVGTVVPCWRRPHPLT
jgi:hypothetical protein